MVFVACTGFYLLNFNYYTLQFRKLNKTDLVEVYMLHSMHESLNCYFSFINFKSFKTKFLLLSKVFKIFILGNLKKQVYQLHSSKEMFLFNNFKNKDFKQTEKKVRNKNVATFYRVASIFNFAVMVKFSLCYIDCYFPLVCEKINLKN